MVSGRVAEVYSRTHAEICGVTSIKQMFAMLVAGLCKSAPA